MKILNYKKRNIPINLVQLLKEKGITKQYIFQKLGIHWDRVNKRTKGKRFPSLEKVTQFTNLLGISFDELLKAPAPELFPGFNETMSYPAEEKAYQIDRLAVEHASISVEMVVQHLKKI